MLIKILIDSYSFFDRHWLSIIAAALISLGVAEGISLALRYSVTLPTIVMPANAGKPVGFGYSDFIEIVLFFLAKIWFDCFLAFLVKSEIEGTPIRFPQVALRALSFYPRIFFMVIATQIVISSGVAAAFSVALLTPPTSFIAVFSILFLIPSFLFSVWFSLIVPIAVIDNLKSIKKALIRSRALVYGFFITVTLALLIAITPPLALAGIEAKTISIWAVNAFLNIASVIIGSIVIVFAYIHLRMAKGEPIIEQVRAAVDDSSQA